MVHLLACTSCISCTSGADLCTTASIDALDTTRKEEDITTAKLKELRDDPLEPNDSRRVAMRVVRYSYMLHRQWLEAIGKARLRKLNPILITERLKREYDVQDTDVYSAMLGAVYARVAPEKLRLVQKLLSMTVQTQRASGKNTSPATTVWCVKLAKEEPKSSRGALFGGRSSSKNVSRNAGEESGVIGGGQGGDDGNAMGEMVVVVYMKYDVRFSQVAEDFSSEQLNGMFEKQFHKKQVLKAEKERCTKVEHDFEHMWAHRDDESDDGAELLQEQQQRGTSAPAATGVLLKGELELKDWPGQRMGRDAKVGQCGKQQEQRKPGKTSCKQCGHSFYSASGTSSLCTDCRKTVKEGKAACTPLITTLASMSEVANGKRSPSPSHDTGVATTGRRKKSGVGLLPTSSPTSDLAAGVPGVALCVGVSSVPPWQVKRKLKQGQQTPQEQQEQQTKKAAPVSDKPSDEGSRGLRVHALSTAPDFGDGHESPAALGQIGGVDARAFVQFFLGTAPAVVASQERVQAEHEEKLKPKREDRSLEMQQKSKETERREKVEALKRKKRLQQAKQERQNVVSHAAFVWQDPLFELPEEVLLTFAFRGFAIARPSHDPEGPGEGITNGDSTMIPEGIRRFCWRDVVTFTHQRATDPTDLDLVQFTARVGTNNADTEKKTSDDAAGREGKDWELAASMSDHEAQTYAFQVETFVPIELAFTAGVLRAKDSSIDHPLEVDDDEEEGADADDAGTAVVDGDGETKDRDGENKDGDGTNMDTPSMPDSTAIASTASASAMDVPQQQQQQQQKQQQQQQQQHVAPPDSSGRDFFNFTGVGFDPMVTPSMAASGDGLIKALTTEAAKLEEQVPLDEVNEKPPAQTAAKLLTTDHDFFHFPVVTGQQEQLWQQEKHAQLGVTEEETGEEQWGEERTWREGQPGRKIEGGGTGRTHGPSAGKGAGDCGTGATSGLAV
jgi:hypothetical protein